MSEQTQTAAEAALPNLFDLNIEQKDVGLTFIGGRSAFAEIQSALAPLAEDEHVRFVPTEELAEKGQLAGFIYGSGWNLQIYAGQSVDQPQHKGRISNLDAWMRQVDLDVLGLKGCFKAAKAKRK